MCPGSGGFARDSGFQGFWAQSLGIQGVRILAFRLFGILFYFGFEASGQLFRACTGCVRLMYGDAVARICNVSCAQLAFSRMFLAGW